MKTHILRTCFVVAVTLAALSFPGLAGRMGATALTATPLLEPQWPSSIDAADGFARLGRAIRDAPEFPSAGSDVEKARYVFSLMGRITEKYGLRPGNGWPLSQIAVGLSRLYSWAFPDPEAADSLKGYFGYGNCGEWSYAVSEIFGGAGISCRVAYGDNDPRVGSSWGFGGTSTMVIVEERSADGHISRRVFDPFNAAHKSPTAIPTIETLQRYGDVPLTDNDRWQDERRRSWKSAEGKRYIKEATSLAVLPDMVPGSRLWPGNTPRPVRVQPVPTGSGSITISGGLDPAEVDREVKQALSNGFQVWYDPVTITMSIAATQAGSTASVSPTKLTMVRHQKNLKDNGLYIKTATMDLEPGQLQPNGYSVKGPITNLLVTFESIPFNTSIPESIRKVPVGNSGWSATRDDHGVWHFVVPESAQFLLK